MPAEEVADEDIEENDETRADAEDDINSRQAEEVEEEQIEENKEKDNNEPVRKII